MNWTQAIDINRTALLRVLAVLLVWVGQSAPHALGEGVISRGVYRRILTVLCPAESALRRLIVVAARGMAVRPHARIAMPDGLSIERGEGDKVPSFPLFDARRQVRIDGLRSRRISDAALPRIGLIGSADAGEDRALRNDPPAQTEWMERAVLARRIARFKRALETLPKQARRLAAWRARHPKNVKAPMRPGRPPGDRRKPVHGIHTILKELQDLALIAHNTS